MLVLVIFNVASEDGYIRLGLGVSTSDRAFTIHKKTGRQGCFEQALELSC